MAAETVRAGYSAASLRLVTRAWRAAVQQDIDVTSWGEAPDHHLVELLGERGDAIGRIDDFDHDRGVRGLIDKPSRLDPPTPAVSLEAF